MTDERETAVVSEPAILYALSQPRCATPRPSIRVFNNIHVRGRYGNDLVQREAVWVLSVGRYQLVEDVPPGNGILQPVFDLLDGELQHLVGLLNGRQELWEQRVAEQKFVH